MWECYRRGQLVELWELEVLPIERKLPEIIRVHRRIVIELTGVKRGVPIEWSDDVSLDSSLIGAQVGTGVIYKKHWHYWPRALAPGAGMPSDARLAPWSSMQVPGLYSYGWVPVEAVHVFRLARRARIALTDTAGEPVRPQSGVAFRVYYCAHHDTYQYYPPTDTPTCTHCSVSALDLESAGEGEECELIRTSR